MHSKTITYVPVIKFLVNDYFVENNHFVRLANLALFDEFDGVELAVGPFATLVHDGKRAAVYLFDQIVPLLELGLGAHLQGEPLDVLLGNIVSKIACVHSASVCSVSSADSDDL